MPNARGRATIRAIELAALDLAEELADEQITVSRICRRAGVTERVFFNHFPSRERAFLGLDQPYIDHDWAQHYVKDPSVPLLTGATRLVRLPVPTDAGQLLRRRAVIARTPRLLAEAHAVLTPIRDECRTVVQAALHTRDHTLSAAHTDLVARVIVAAAAELVDADPAEVTEAIRTAHAYLR